MLKKKSVFLITSAVMIILLWFGGIIPKRIAKKSGTDYVKEHFPEMQLECTSIEWSDVYGDYLIAFKAKNGKVYSCVIGPKYFPVSMGQGLFAIESDYQENYK